MKQLLHDSNGRPMDSITITNSGKREDRDANRRLKGSYDPKPNQTRDSNGQVVGKGNVLTAVIASSLFC